MQLLIYLLITVLLLPVPAFSGTIKGTAVFSGKTDHLKPYKTGKYKKACGSSIPNESILIDNKRIRNAVISLYGKNLNKKKGEYKLDQRKCQ